MTIDSATTALLMLHWQNELCLPKGKLAHSLPERIKEAHNVEHAQAALKASREKGVLVVHVRIAFRPGYPEIPAKAIPMEQALRESGGFMDGTWGAEIIGDLELAKGDIVITNKCASAFADTELGHILVANGITTVVLAGMVTNLVVSTTCADAVSRGYFVYILQDCCNSWSEEQHLWPLNNTLSLLSFISDSSKYIKALGAK
jgi:nicotinamidase-related amidase